MCSSLTNTAFMIILLPDFKRLGKGAPTPGKIVMHKRTLEKLRVDQTMRSNQHTEEKMHPTQQHDHQGYPSHNFKMETEKLKLQEKKKRKKKTNKQKGKKKKKEKRKNTLTWILKETYRE